MDMSVTNRMLVQLADNTAFMLSSYICGIGAWAAISKHDFISSNWKSVRATRRSGQVHVVLVLLPLGYVVFYIYVLALKGDFKLGAAVFALMFAILHFLRTMLALWQLNLFKKWAESAIESIESLGYRCYSAGGYEPELEGYKISEKEASEIRINYIADEIPVNNSIVENKLSSGVGVCRLRFISQLQKRFISNQRYWVARACWTVYFYILGMLRLPGLLIAVFFPKWWDLSHIDCSPYLEPYFSEEVYLRWACVLIANATPDWLADLKELCKRDLEDDKHKNPRESRREEFALELLLSAGMHLREASSNSNANKGSGFEASKNDFGCTESKASFRHSFLPFEEWKNYPILRKGLFQREEFLKFACTSGIGLPFHAPHHRAEIKEKDGSSYKYSKFASFLAGANVQLDAELEEAVKDLGIVEVEWLSVFLSVNNWRGISKDSKRAQVELLKETKKKPFKEKEADIPKKMKSSDIDETGFPMVNLSRQLGFCNVSKSFLRYFSHPLLKTSYDRTLWENRNILELSAHIDNWLALRSGDEAKYMMKQMENHVEDYLLRHIEATCDPTSKFKMVYERNKHLQVDQSMFQFALIEPDNYNYEHSTTFLGCSMEVLRSSLARWTANNEETQLTSWNPNLDNGIRDKTFHFKASEDLSCCVKSLENVDSLQEKYFHMRLLWELQSYFHARMSREHKQSPGPMDAEAIILCILSFPSILIRADCCASSGLVSQNRNSCCINIDEESEHLDIEKYKIVIESGCGPQNVGVEVYFEMKPELLISICISSGRDPSNTFSWEAWRNAFLGRMEGARSWQMDWNLPNIPVTNTEDTISAGLEFIRTINPRESKGLITWKGWLPHRLKLCQFELETKGFVKRRIILPLDRQFISLGRMHLAKRLDREDYVPVEYANADPRSLKRASFFAVEALMNRFSKIVPDDDQEVSYESFQNRIELISEDKYFQLVLLKYSSIEYRNVGDLNKAITLLSLYNEFVHEAVRLLERFYMSSEKLEKFFKDSTTVESVEAMFKSLLLQSSYSAKVAKPFARFYTTACSCGREDMYGHARKMLFQSMIENMRARETSDALECRFALQDLVKTDRHEELSFTRATLLTTIDPLSSLKSRIVDKRRRKEDGPALVPNNSFIKWMRKSYKKSLRENNSEPDQSSLDEIEIERGISDARQTLEIIEEMNK